MKVEGGCYCGAVRYKAEGDPMMVGQCHCRECQYISGGSPNMLAAMPINGFEYTKGKPKGFTRDNLERAVTREFCADCGTHLLTGAPGFDGVVLKLGTLDDPEAFGGPKMAIFTMDQRSYHQIAEGIPTFERMPG